MSRVEAAFCRAAPWQSFAHRVVLPWATSGVALSGAALEIGCGGGAMAAAALDRWPGIAHYTATDVDPAMVHAAAARLARYGDRASAETVDASALPYPAASFDAVLSFIMLHHTITWPSVLAECARVLRPGGLLVGYDVVETRLAHLVHLADRSTYRLLGARELRDGLRECGFDVVTYRPALAGAAVRFSARRA